MKKIITFSIFALSLFNFCLADGLPISDVIKEARDKATVSESVNTETNNKVSTETTTQTTKQDIKDNVTDTLDDLKEVN